MVADRIHKCRMTPPIRHRLTRAGGHLSKPSYAQQRVPEGKRRGMRPNTVDTLMQSDTNDALSPFTTTQCEFRAASVLLISIRRVKHDSPTENLQSAKFATNGLRVGYGT